MNRACPAIKLDDATVFEIVDSNIFMQEAGPLFIRKHVSLPMQDRSLLVKET